MIKIPFQEIINKIKEASYLSEEEIHTRIDEKTRQLSGLISKDGAAHIIANELGIRVIDQVSGKLQIKNILSGMRSVETAGKVLENYGVREFNSAGREGKVASFLLGDESGTIRVVSWGATADIAGQLAPGSIVKIVSGYVRDNRGFIEVHVNEKSKLIVNPEGIAVGDLKPEIARKSIKDLKDGDRDIEIFGTIVQVFEPKFFEVCPECGSRARLEGSEYRCRSHGSVVPSYSYVTTIVLDDGTETMRIACFRKEAESLLGISQQEFQQIRKDPGAFEPWKTELLGNQIIVKGRCNHNQMFDRLEFVASFLNTSPNPQEEIARLEAK